MALPSLVITIPPMGSISILSPCDLNHGLGSGVLHSDLPKNGIAVVGHHDPAHGVHQHLEHGPGAKAGADNVPDGLAGVDVARLHILARVALGVLTEHHYGSSTHDQVVRQSPSETEGRI